MGGRKKIVIDTKRIEQLAAQGLSKEEIILCLDINESTYYRNQQNNPEMQVAYMRGRARGVEKATKALLEYNIGEVKDIKAIQYYLGQRADNFKDKIEVRHTGDKDNPVQVETKVTNSLDIAGLTADLRDIMAIARKRKEADEAKGINNKG